MAKNENTKKFTLRFSRLKPRFLFITAIILGLIFLAIIIVGIRENQNNMLRMLQREGSALMESIFISAQNNIRAGDLVDDLVIDNLVDAAALIELDMQSDQTNTSDLTLICQLLGYNRIDIINSDGIIAQSNYSNLIGTQYDSAFSSRLPLNDLIFGSAGVVTFVLDGADIFSTDQLVAAVSGEMRPGIIVLFMNYQMLDRSNRRIGLGYMIRQIGGQPGIDYIFLQTPEGVMLSSRKLAPVLSIANDPFLDSLMSESGEKSRKHIFEDHEVLEVCRQFISKDFPPGILRVGVSLQGYHQVARNFKVQLAVLGVILFTLTFLFITITISNQDYRATARAYDQFKNITSNILGGIENAVLAVDANRKIIMLNPRTEQLFGISGANCIGKDYSDIFSEDNFQINYLLDSGKESIIKEHIYKIQDNNYTLFITGSVLTDETNNIQGAVGICLDITSQKELEMQAKQAERMSELGTLAAGVAHEIRNPLNSIAIASQRLKSEFQVSDDQEGYTILASTITSEIERLNAIIVEFLALARSGQMNKEQINLKKYIDEIIDLFENETKNLKIEINSRLDPDIEINIDLLEMKKVIGNLIKNSIEAITVNGEIAISSKCENDRIKIIIQDNGPGIDQSKINEIFTPYFTTKDTGTGLGLSISHRIVASHDGTFIAENVKPHGARFIISLPA